MVNERTHDEACLTVNENAVRWHHAGWYEKEKRKKRKGVSFSKEDFNIWMGDC